MDISCIILAGGKSLRLGRSKVLESIGNGTLLEWVVSYLSSFSSEIIIVTATQQSTLPFISYPKLRVVTDIYPGKGPLGGIYAGLTASNSFHNLVVACDMPFLNQALLGYMIQLSADFDVVIARLDDMIEPLHAIYSRDCLAAAEYLIKQGNLAVRELFSLVKVRYVEAEEINRFDPGHLSFFNINTEADLKRAEELAKVV